MSEPPGGNIQILNFNIPYDQINAQIVIRFTIASIVFKMEELLQIDPNFSFLYNAINSPEPTDTNEIVTMMTRFRKNLSFDWLKKLPKENSKLEPIFALIIQTILKYTVHSDATVRVTTYGTLGGLLVTVAPFGPVMFIRAFGKAIMDVEITPKLSIAVINMFMYLTRFMSPVKIHKFIVEIPIQPHFGVDVSDFIKYLPQVIPMMENLPVDLLKVILRSVITGAGRKPNTAFVQTVTMLVNINKKELLDLLITFIKENESGLSNAAVWLSPSLFTDKEIFDGLTEEGRELFLNHAIEEFGKTPLNLCQFEHACKTCALFLRYTRGTSEYDKIMERIQAGMKPQYPEVYKARMLLLPTPIEKLEENIDITNSFSGNKLSAIATYFEDNVDTCDHDRVAELFLKFKSTENDLYCTLIDSFARCIDTMLVKCKGTAHIELLEFILRKKNQNWVHDETVANMIDNITTDKCQRVFPAYTDLALDRLLDYALSTNDRLFATAIKSVVKFASYDNIDNILNRIYHSDWMSEAVLSRRFQLLAELAAVFDITRFPKFFIDIALESLTSLTMVPSFSNVYAYLARAHVKHVPAEICDFSFEFLIKHYQIYSRTVFGHSKYQVPMSDQFFLGTLDTDIVTNPTVNHEEALVHIRNCYAFLCSLPKECVNEESLFQCSVRLIILFDEFALEESLKLAESRNGYTNIAWCLSQETFKSTSRDEVAASCCKFFVNSRSQELPKDIEHDIENFLTIDATDNPDLLYLCFILVDQRDHEKALMKVPELLNRLPTNEGVILLFRLSGVLKLPDIENLGPEYNIALLNYALTLKGEYETIVWEYVQKIPFASWPLRDSDIKSGLVQFISQNPEFKVKIEDPSVLDNEHWRFVVNNKTIFDLETIIPFMKENLSIFAKMDISSFIKPAVKTFHLSEVDAIKIATIGPFINKGILIESIPHIIGYFTNSKKPMPPELLDKYIHFAIDSESKTAVLRILEFCMRTSSTISSFDHDIFFSDEVIHATLRQLARYKSLKSIPEALRARIERKLGKEITPELIYDQSDLAVGITRLDTGFFFQNSMNMEEYKAHLLFPLIARMNAIAVEPAFMIKLIKDGLDMYKEWPYDRTRKRTALLRFMSCALLCSRSQGRRKEKEFMEIVNIIYDAIPMLTENMISSFYTELVHMLPYLVPFTSSVTNIMQIVTGITPESALYGMYAVGMALMQVNRKEKLKQLGDTGFKNAIHSSGNRSSKLAGTFRALSTVIGPNGDKAGLKIATKLKNEIAELFPMLTKDFLGYAGVAPLVARMMMNDQATALDEDFYIMYMNAFMKSQRLASFTLSLPLCQLIAKKIPDTFKLLMRCDFMTMEMANAISSIIITRLNAEKQQSRREARSVELFQEFLPYFRKFPTTEMCKLLLQLANTDVASFFFMKLPMDRTILKWLPLYCFLHKMYTMRDEKAKNDIRNVIDASPYVPESRNRAMKMICQNSAESQLLSFILAASETDSVESMLEEVKKLSHVV